MKGDQGRTRRFSEARRDPALAVLHGFHVLKHALRFDADVLEAWAAEDADLRTLARRLAPDLADRLEALCEPISRADLERLRVPGHAEVVALARRPAVAVEEALAPGDRPVVFLDRPTHHGNIGAVVRVSAAAGAAAVLTTGPHDPWHPNALRGGAGLQFALPVARVETLPPTTRPVVALDPEGDPVFADDPSGAPGSALRGPAPVLVFGSERRGVSAELLERADRRVRIPMREGVSSLNLATSVAVALYCGGGSGSSSA